MPSATPLNRSQSLSPVIYVGYAFQVLTVPYLCEKLKLLLVFIKERHRGCRRLIAPSDSGCASRRCLLAPPSLACVRVCPAPPPSPVASIMKTLLQKSKATWEQDFQAMASSVISRNITNIFQTLLLTPNKNRFRMFALH